MTRNLANALYRYFETLYGLNQNLIILCGVNIFDEKGQLEKYIEKVIMDIPRLVPYVFDRKTSSYRLEPKDGLMEFAEEIPFLQESYDSVLQAHKDFLEKAKKVRNKLEHKMHGADVLASSSSSFSFFSITYEVTEEVFCLEAEEIISFVKDINVLFDKIQSLLDQYATKIEMRDHPYYCRMVRYRFSDFNRIYESNLLHIIGKALLPF